MHLSPITISPNLVCHDAGNRPRYRNAFVGFRSDHHAHPDFIRLMTRKSTPVHALASEAEIDVPEVLAVLWELGLPDVLESHDLVPHYHLKRVRAGLGLASLRELRTLSYWTHLLGQSADELRATLLPFSASIKPGAKRLPPGAIKTLRRFAFSRGINPSTGKPTDPQAFDPPTRSPTQTTSSTVVTADTARTPTPTQPELHDHVEPSPIPTQIKPATTPPPSFARLGRPLTDDRWLDVDNVKDIHYRLVEDFAKKSDPISPPGVRSEDLLASALFRPRTGLRDVRKYPTVETAAASLLHAMIHNHPFHNGNKRTALVAMLVFLDWHGLVLTCDERDLFRLIIRVAQHRMIEQDFRTSTDHETYAIAKWIVDRRRVVTKGENIIPFRKLQKILLAYGCEIGNPGSGYIEITRRRDNTQRRRPFGRRHLSARIHYRNKGEDVQIFQAKRVRKELHLDHKHGVDSTDFYAKGDDRVDDFIAKYRVILNRLARFDSMDGRK